MTQTKAALEQVRKALCPRLGASVRCGMCKFRVRGVNHETGTHHKAGVKRQQRTTEASNA
jgi:hypothetical protein